MFQRERWSHSNTSSSHTNIIFTFCLVWGNIILCVIKTNHFSSKRSISNHSSFCIVIYSLTKKVGFWDYTILYMTSSTNWAPQSQQGRGWTNCQHDLHTTCQQRLEFCAEKWWPTAVLEDIAICLQDKCIPHKTVYLNGYYRGIIYLFAKNWSSLLVKILP